MKVMTIGEMATYADRLVDIVSSESTDDIRNERLATLMTDLEVAYQISSLSANAQGVDPIALEFYQMVSAERGFECE